MDVFAFFFAMFVPIVIGSFSHDSAMGIPTDSRTLRARLAAEGQQALQDLLQSIKATHKSMMVEGEASHKMGATVLHIIKIYIFPYYYIHNIYIYIHGLGLTTNFLIIPEIFGIPCQKNTWKWNMMPPPGSRFCQLRYGHCCHKTHGDPQGSKCSHPL